MRYRVQLIGHTGITLATLSIDRNEFLTVCQKLRSGTGLFTVGDLDEPPFDLIPAGAVATAKVEVEPA